MVTKVRLLSSSAAILRYATLCQYFRFNSSIPTKIAVGELVLGFRDFSMDIERLDRHSVYSVGIVYA